jgi:DNA-binding XRE family transcriptional regulator
MRSQRGRPAAFFSVHSDALIQINTFLLPRSSILLQMQLSPSTLRVIELRKRLSLTQSEFAAALNHSIDGIRAIEQGRYGVSRRLARKISRAFGARPEWLLEKGVQTDFDELQPAELLFGVYYYRELDRSRGDREAAVNAGLEALLQLLSNKP